MAVGRSLLLSSFSSAISKPQTVARIVSGLTHLDFSQTQTPKCVLQASIGSNLIIFNSITYFAFTLHNKGLINTSVTSQYYSVLLQSTVHQLYHSTNQSIMVKTKECPPRIDFTGCLLGGDLVRKPVRSKELVIVPAAKSIEKPSAKVTLESENKLEQKPETKKESEKLPETQSTKKEKVRSPYMLPRTNDTARILISS